MAKQIEVSKGDGYQAGKQEQTQQSSAADCRQEQCRQSNSAEQSAHLLPELNGVASFLYGRIWRVLFLAIPSELAKNLLPFHKRFFGFRLGSGKLRQLNIETRQLIGQGTELRLRRRL